jgi:predicted O-methyltransferase YrrM
MIDLLPFFPNAKELGRVDDDVCYCDFQLGSDHGFLSLKESEILYQVAKANPGFWCEIGSHVGWGAAVIMSAGCSLVAVDEEFDPEGPVYARFTQNLERAGYDKKIVAINKSSEDFFKLGPRKFDGYLIDGCHNEPVPLEDAKSAAERLTDKGVIIMHDTREQSVKDALDWLRRNGFSVTDNETINGIAVARRI